MIGLERGVLRLVPYCDDWPQPYEQEAERVRAAIGRHILDIQHVGSTAIPGMIAKPIIDIDVAVRSLEDGELCINPLQVIGYEYRRRDETPKSHYLVKGDPPEYHLRIFETESEDWREHIRFRDRLRHDSTLVRDYTELKRQLFRELKGDRKAYQEGKSDFVKRVSSEAWPERSAPADVDKPRR